MLRLELIFLHSASGGVAVTPGAAQRTKVPITVWA
jgi:hypothetical protein